MGKTGRTTYYHPEQPKKTGRYKNTNKNTGDPLAYIGTKVGLGIAGTVEGIGKLIEGTGALLSGNENYAKYVFQNSQVDEWRQDLDEQFNPDLFMQTLGAAGEGIGQSTTFLLNAAVPFLGTGMFFSGVVGNSIGNAVNMTGDLGVQEYGYGLTVGAAEAALEKLLGVGSAAAKTIATKGATTVSKSIGKAVVGRAARNGVLKSIVKESAGEFMEEFLGDYVDVTAQKIWGVNQNAEYSLSQALYSGLVGAISGAAMGGTVELTSAARYTAAGQRVIRNGNVDALMRQANAVADAFGTNNTAWTQRGRMNQLIASIQASTDAYNALSDEAKQGARGAMLLGEIEGGIFGLQATRGVEIAADQILQKAEKFADYASKESGKTYTVEDLKANKDGILASLAVRKFAGEFMRSPELSPEVAVDEAAIDAIREREGATVPGTPNTQTEAIPFEEMGDPFETESPIVTVRSIADSAEWDGETATFADEGGEQTTILTNEDGTYDLYLEEMDEQDPDSNRLEGLAREQVEEILRERAEAQVPVAVNEEIREESANEADEGEESEAVSEELHTGEEAAEESAIEEGADSSEPVTSKDQETTETDEEGENTTEKTSGEETTEESAVDSTEDVTGEEGSAEEVKEEQPPPKKRKTVASRSAASKTAQDGKLEDFGEKIGGARKDLWKETGLRASDVSELGERDAEKYVKKDFVWKRPDYKKLLADGADVAAIYWVKTVRDACPTAPYIPYAATDEIKTVRREQFVELVQTVKNAVSEIRTVSDLQGKDMVDIALVQTGWLTKVDGTERYSATEKGKNMASELSAIVYELRRTDDRSLKRLAAEAERKQFGVSKDDKIPAGFQIKFDDGSSSWLTPHGEERRPNTWYITHGFQIVGGQFHSKESALEWLKEKLAPKKKDGKSRFVPKQLERVHREGADHRKNDTVDITGDDYLKQFGFRGGEYGNWVNQQERQTSLNYGYDALMDLAEALGVSTTDISLGGTLAIAFGARGNGGAMAHYEPGQKVINLTKMKGAGSLAHEWFHALDDYMGTLFGRNGGLLSTDRGNTYAPLSQLIETMKYKNASAEQQQNHRKRQLELRKDGLKKTVMGMLTGLSEEKKGELAERLVAMAESEEIHGSVMGGPYMDAITKISEEKKTAVGRGIVKENRENIYWTMYRYAQAVKDADQPLKVETDFYKGSKRFGAIHARQDGYWDSNEEMLARAFACYITDKLDGQSDYLSGHSESAVSFDVDRNGEPVIVKAIPEGDERIAINEAFDRLFADLKENGHLNASAVDYSALGTAKYSLSSTVAEEAVLKGEKETQFTVSAETDQNERRASLASIQDRARKVVAQYDLQSAEVRYAIEEMYRSADEQGADPAAADAAAHLIAVLKGVEIRFDKGISKNGVIDTLPSGKRLILISPKTDAKGGAVTTLLHEVTHYLEKSESYRQLSKVALESYPAEKAEEIRKRYRDYAKANGKEFSDEYIEQEVVAEAVGELLAKGKYIARMRNRSGLVDAITWLGRIAQGVVGKNREVHEAARHLWIAFSKCLASTKAEAAEELRRYAFKGYAEDGKGIYESNFPKGTPKKAKAERILHYIQNVWSKKPIALTIEDAFGQRIIEARFDPTYDETTGKASDASKLMGGNRHGTSSEQRVTLDLADDYYQIASESAYNYSKDEVGKTTDPHRNVKQWHYFINDIYFAEQGSDNLVPYRVTINVKEKADGNYIYSFSAEKTEETSTQRTLHAAVSSSSEATTNGDLSKDSIPHESDSVKREERKYSLPRLQSDRAYLDAVERGDTATAQRMVNEAAELALPDTVVRDESGKLLPMYHGTGNGGFTVFSDYHWKFGLFGMGFYFTADREVADSYQQKGKGARKQTYTVYLDIHHPIDMDAPADLAQWRKAIPEAEDYFADCKTGEDCFSALKEYCADEMMVRWEAEDLIIDVMRGMGYDGITHIGGGRFNKKDENRHRVYIAFDSDQIKSAEPVTYDDAGNVIPLSERFSKQNVDIRYSLPESETAEERAERAEQKAKKEKARADRLMTELHSYREYGINAGDVYALANERMREYSGGIDKNVLRRMLLKAADHIAYLNKHPNATNAATIGRSADKYISDFAEEVIYHQKEEIDPQLKEMRSYMKGLRISISENLKSDLDRFGGYEAFRRQNMGRGLILSKAGTPVESIYPELTAQFGEGAFPSSIKNPVDQLIQIATTLKEGTLTEKAFVDFDALARAEATLIRAELTSIVRSAELLKPAYNPVWNAGTANGSNEAVVTYYTPDATRRIMNAADGLVQKWAEKNSATKRFQTGMRERVESEFLYRLNTAQKSDRSDAAEQLVSILLEAQEFVLGAETVTVEKNGKTYKRQKGGTRYSATELPGADARGLSEELARLIRIKANAEENRMEGTRYARMEAAENAALREEVASLKSQMELAARIKSLLDLSKGRTKPSEKVSLDEMNVVIEEFSKIVTKGRISPERAQKFILWLNTYLSSKEPTGTISYLKETINESTLQILSDFANMDVSEPGAMGALQLKALNDLFFEIRHAYDTYGMVKINGEWKDSVEIAQKGVADAKGSLLHLNRRKTLKEKINRQVMQFMLQSQDPLRTAMMLEGYAEGGVLSKLIYDVIMGEAQRTSMQMEFLSGFEDFFKSHKGYQQKLATKMLKLGAFAGQNGNPFEITLGEAMSLLGLSRREQAKAGLANSDIYFANDEEGARMVQGGWARWADMDTNQRISMLTGGISEIASQMEEEDLQFFKMVEDFFNKVSSDVKRKADVDYFGHEMMMEDYYFPIYRDRATIAEEVADAAKRMQSFITASNQSFNKQTMKNAEKSLYIANVYDVVTKHATGLATYSTLYRPVLNFNTIWNQQTSGNKNSPESMRSVYQRNVWDGIDAYMKNLFDAVQGITTPKGPLSKVFSTVRGNAVFFQLGLNPKTWLTQWTSIIASLDVLSVPSVQKGLASGRKANDEAMDKYSIFARTRDYNMEVVKAEGAGDQIHKVGEWTMQPISKMDRMVIRKLWAACQHEVEAREGFAIDSEENNVAAGKLLDEVILRTQQTAGMATKSGYMRGGELEKSLTMFSSDAMKQLSSLTERMMRYQKHRADVKKGVPGADEKLVESKQALVKTGIAAMGVAVAGAMIAQLFKAIYDRDRRKKKDGTEVSVVTDVAADSWGNLVGILPLVRELHDMLDSGYEVTDFTLDAFNEIISGYIKVGDTVKSAVAGEYVTTEEIGASTRQFLYSTGMLFGIPTRNFNNIIEGTLNMTTDELHWGYTSLFQKPSYQKDLDEAIENGDSALAELILTTWLEREKVGTVGDELDVLMELYVKDYDFLPSSAPTKLNAKQRKEWMESMEEIQSQAAQMVLSSSWQSFTEEAKAEALKKLYRNRQSALKTDLLGEKRTKGALLSELYGYVPVAEISGMASATETYEDEDGREITKRQQVEEVLSQYEGDEAILLYLAGYTSQEAKRILASKVLEIASTEEERNELYKLLGIDPEDL